MIAVFISGGGSNLQALIDSPFQSQLSLVFSNKEDAYGLERAKKAGIRTLVISHRRKKRVFFEQEVLEELQKAKVKWILLAGFMRILSSHFLAAYQGRVINIHPSLLPSFSGINAQKQAWDAGAQVSGATIHFVDEGVDTGEIIVQGVVPRFSTDDAATFKERILEMEHILYPKVLSWISTGSLDQTKRPSYDRFVFWKSS